MTQDISSLVGAYVLDALDDDERREFEAAMASTPELAAEVDSLREVTGLLGAAAAEPPPPGMRADVLSRIDTVRQERPVVSDLDEVRQRRQRTSDGWALRLATGAAAVAALIAVGLGVVVGQLSTRIDEVQASSQQVAAIVAAEDAQRVAADLPDGGHLNAVFSAEQNVAVVVGENLGPLDEDQMYALWAIVDGQPLPAGELVAGHAATVAGQPLDSVGLTVEPRGPLDEPTGEVIAMLGA